MTYVKYNFIIITGMYFLNFFLLVDIYIYIYITYIIYIYVWNSIDGLLIEMTVKI